MINFNGAIVSRGEEGVQRGKKETNKVEIPRGSRASKENFNWHH